ncbi:MAG: hypothetical protein FWF37_02755, partial [Chloroflexi bacterium]|nr:hypothetical protein [Chloroflexota bacterium]
MFKKLFKRMATALAIIVLLVSTFGGVAGAGSETRAIQDLRLYSSIVLQLQFSDDPVQTFNSLSEKEQDKVKEVIFYHFENIQAIIDANGSDLEIEAYIDNIPQAVLLLMQIDLDYLGLWAQVSAEKYDIMPPWNPADEQALRLQDLLYRIDEFNSFDAEERAIVLDYFGMVDEWFIPDEEEGPTQEDLENAAIERILVLRNLYQNYEFFSQLSDDNKLSLYDLLDFDLEQVLAIDAQFSYLEDLGYSLLVSSDIIRIANVGFLSLEEVMVALENSINMPQLLSKFREFTQLAALFNLEEASRQNSKDAILSDNKTIIDSALDQQLWRETGLDEFSEDALQIQELLYQAYTSYDAYQTAKGLFIAGYSVNDIKLAFFLGAALALDPQDVINSSAQAIVNYALGNGQSLTSNQKSASLSIGDLSEADYADMLLLISFGASVMYLGGMMLSSTPGLPSIEAPFIAYLGESDAVNLSTGAFYYHENILNVPGRNGLDLVLGITYDSSQADLYKPIYDYWYGDNSIISPTMLEELWNIGAGWSFDLPYIYNDTFKNTYNIHIPGKGTFEFNGTPISNVHNWINYPLQDMVLTNFTGYTHGGGSYRTETSQYKLTFKDGSYYYFNSNGQIILHADNFSNTIRYQYALQSTFDSRYLLSNIVDTAGKNYTLTYSAPSGG